MTVQSVAKLMEIVSIVPMLDIPGWLESANAPKDPMVVKALRITARGV